MQVETFSDVLDWTRAVHRNLAASLADAAGDVSEERVRMLLDYLASQEKEMAVVIERSKEDADQKALHTFVYDYIENAPLKPREISADAFMGKNTDEVLETVMGYHDEIIQLYTYLHGRAEVPSTKALVDDLLAYERQEWRQVMSQAHRFDDL